jgi:predicted unusual protein kinase regulating ubiquinone biosynthesis (AarF/ABC1/UbiB family)
MKPIFESVKRYLTLGKVFLLARRVLSRRSAEERLLAQRALAEVLAQARGVAMKAGQIAASFGDAQELRRLVEGIEPRPLQEIEPVLRQRLGRPLEEVFAKLEESRAAASLGQVHRAILHDGTVVAVKVCYPDIGDAVYAEMAVAGLMPGVGPLRRFQFDLESYKQMLRANMERELDYLGEAERQAAFFETMQVPGLVVPRVYRELCAEGVLVQSWEDGVALEEAAAWSRRDRLLIAWTLLQTLFTSLFVTGEVHGDPNPGNYFVRRTAQGQPQVVLLDYGCTMHISRRRRLALLKLVLKTRDGDATDIPALLAAVGFAPEKLLPIASDLPPLCQILLTPILADRGLAIDEWRLGERTEELLGELRWWFRSSSPPDVLLLIRAFQGLLTQLKALDIVLPWWPLLWRTVGEELLAEAQAFEPPPLPQELVALLEGPPPIARLLKVRAIEKDEEVLALSLPALEVLNLGTLVPAEPRQKLLAAGIRLEDIVERVKANGMRAQEVLSFDDGERLYRVWLE